MSVAPSIAKRWRVVRELGSSLLARTVLAEELARPGQKVVLKELDLAAAEDWKEVELFERGARALKELDHPQIPRFHDVFFDDAAHRFYLVQEFVEGIELGEKLARDGKFGDAALREFLESMLGILEYLHGSSPPVVHRDIKPSNIMVAPDGAYILVDFDAVQTIIGGRVGGTTVAGTTGYMPPEQLFGKAVPASDIYALGATAVHLASGVEPWRLPAVRNQIQFEHAVSISEHLQGVLRAMLQPQVDARAQDVAQVRALLAGHALPARIAPAQALRRAPNEVYDASGRHYDDIRVRMHGEELQVELFGRRRFSVFYAVLAVIIYFFGVEWLWPQTSLLAKSIIALAAVPVTYSSVWGLLERWLGVNQPRKLLVISPTHVELRRQSHFGLGHWRAPRRVVWSIPREQVVRIGRPGGMRAVDDAAQALAPAKSRRYQMSLQITDKSGAHHEFCVDYGKTSRYVVIDKNAELAEVIKVIQAYLRDY